MHMYRLGGAGDRGAVRTLITEHTSNHFLKNHESR